MKKILMLLLLFPMIVFADEFSVYNAIVTNKNGIKYTYINDQEKEINAKIKYNEKILVSLYKNNWNKKTIINGYSKYGSFEIKLNDVQINKDEFTCGNYCEKDSFISYPIGINTEQYQKQMINFNKNGVNLKKGPANDFKDLDTIIPYNETFKVINNIFIFDPENDIDYWKYVEYNGKYGWINAFNTEGLYYPIDSVFMTMRKLDITLDGKIIGSIPANTEISPNYYSKDYYINYNGVSGFISADGLAHNWDSVQEDLIKYEHKLLSEANKNSKVITNIPANTVLKYHFEYETFEEESNNKYLHCIYTKYNNHNGWVCYDKGEVPGYVNHRYNNENNSKANDNIKIDNKEPNWLLIVIISIITGSLLIAGIVFLIVYLSQKNQEKIILKKSLIEEDKD